MDLFVKIRRDRRRASQTIKPLNGRQNELLYMMLCAPEDTWVCLGPDFDVLYRLGLVTDKLSLTPKGYEYVRTA